MKVLKYYFCLIYQLFLVAMFYLKITHLFWVPLLVLAMVGTIDYLIPENTASPKNTANKAYRVLPKVYIPLQLLTIYGAVDFFVNVPHSLLESILLIATTGIVVSTSGFTVAHELMHGKKMDRYLALILLFSMNYPHFLYQHLFVHHVWVATKKDCGTSWYGESLYRFVPRAFFTGYVKAYRALETDPRGKKITVMKNPVFHIAWMSLLINILIYALFGGKALFAFVSISLVCIFSIEVAEYIQHYGLLRRKVSENRYEKMRAQFAWQSYAGLSKYMILNMQRHGAHHENPTAPYQELRYDKKVPVMPFSQPFMYVLAMIPSLWFKIMNPLVEEVRENNYYRDS